MNTQEEEQLEQLIDRSKQRVLSNDRRFWILSSIWLLFLVAISIFVISYFNKLDDLKGELNTLNLEIILQEQTFENKFSAIESRFTQIQMHYLDSGEIKEFLVNDLIKSQLSRNYVSDTESQIIESNLRINKDENSPEYNFNEGIGLLNDSKLDDAVEFLTRAININDRAEYRYARGVAYRKMGKYSSAEIDFSSAIELDPNSHEYYSGRAFIRFKIGRLESALKDADKAIALNPNQWVGHHYRGLILFKKNNPDQAIQAWKTAKERAFTQEQAANSLENISLIYVNNEEWDKAIVNSEYVNTIDAEKPWNWLFLMIAYDKTKKPKKGYVASKKWNELGSEEDAKSLRDYIDSKLYSYLRRN